MNISLCNMSCERMSPPSPLGGKFVEYAKQVGNEGSFKEASAPFHVEGEPASLQPRLHGRLSPQGWRPVPGL